MLEEKFIKIPMIFVNQSDSAYVLTGKIKFGQLNEVYKLTERQESDYDPSPDDYQGRLSLLHQEDIEFQRHLDNKRLKDIVQFLSKKLDDAPNKGVSGIFPSSLILYNREYHQDISDDRPEMVNENYIQNIYETNKNLESVFVTNHDTVSGLCELYIPRKKGITLIVDGQHRFFGAKKLYDILTDPEKKQKVENFEFIVTYLIGFDLHEVGQIFANVNFKQKPVNKSLYYDIFGSLPQVDDSGELQNSIQLLHYLTLHLQNNENSPIKNMIKLLGRGSGFFSQAFFVDQMQKYVVENKVWIKYFNLYTLHHGKNTEYNIIAKFMKDYFFALQESYPNCWPEFKQDGNYKSSSYNCCLLKTTGLGAYIRLIKDIYPVVSKDGNIEFKNELVKIFRRISKEQAEKLFINRPDEGGFNGAGSESLQKQLYEELLRLYGLSKQKPLDF